MPVFYNSGINESLIFIQIIFKKHMHNEEEKEVSLGEVILDDDAILEDELLDDEEVDELLEEEDEDDLIEEEEDLVDEDEIDLDIAWKDDY